MRKFMPSVMKYSPEAEIVVADNGSTDNSAQMLHTGFPEVKVLFFDKNYGFAEGYNKALAEISTPYALLLNDDVEVTPNWLQPLLAFMEEHESVAACQPKVLSEVRREYFEYAGACGGFLDILGYPYCRGRMMDVVEKDKGQYDEPCSIFWGTGAALLVRTEVYKKVGGLDARFFAHMEEIDFCWRLHSRGYDIYCVPQSKIYHYGGGTLPKGNPHKTFLNFRNGLLMLYKNLPTKTLSWVLFVRRLLDYVAAMQMLLSGRRSEAWAVVQARNEYCHIHHEFDAQREDNLKKQTVRDIPELRKESLLFAFYFKRKRKYSDWA